MLDSCATIQLRLGEALRAALDRWPDEICLIEADRDRENVRLTYRQFKEIAHPLAARLQDAGFQNGTRAAIIMTNQSKWLISAYAIFFCGGVLVPLDYKLTAAEQLKLLAHSKAEFLVIEYHLWRAITQDEDFSGSGTRASCWSPKRPPAPIWTARSAGRNFASRATRFLCRAREPNAACIVYSSGTGGRPKGCVLTHENYLEQCMALTSLYPFWPGVRYLSILPTNHAIDFMVGFIGPFTCGATVVHLRTLRPEFIRDAFTRYKITYMSLVPLVLKNLERGLRQRFEELAQGQAQAAERRHSREPRAHAQAAEPQRSAARLLRDSSRGLRRRIARAVCRRRVHRTEDACSFSTISASPSATAMAAPKRARRSP